MFFATQSSFLSDIDIQLLNCVNNSKIGASMHTPVAIPKTCFSVGDRVSHKLFGEGVIVSVDEKTQVYGIAFKNVNGVRRLQFRAELTLL